jgi:hypothetical protein
LVVRNLWGADRICYTGPDGRTRSVPIEWTDLGEVDPFVVLAQGRSPFRLEDLLAVRARVPRGGGAAAEGA